MANELLNELGFLLNEILRNNIPIYSGNMSYYSPRIEKITENKFVIVIDAPQYDVDYYEKTKQIRYTHGNYAKSVNDYGGFHTYNESMHWVNRSCKMACDVIAGKNKGEVKNHVKL